MGDSNTNENYNDECNNVENKECNIENNNVFEELVSEVDTVKISNENTEEFLGCDYEMLRCVNELERERKNKIVVEWGQRVNFPLIVDNVYDDLMSSQVLLLKGKSPVLIDELKYLFLLCNFIPSVYNNCESVMWCYEEREVNREWYGTELYNLNRKYGEWKESLKVYLNNNNINILQFK